MAKKRAIKQRIIPAKELRYDIREGSEILAQSVAKTYIDIKAGKIQVIRDGGRTYIPGSELIRLASLPPAAAA